MFIKIRRDTLIILILAFILILSGQIMTYMAYASSNETDNGVAISGIIIKGNNIVPISSIRSNIGNTGFRSGSYIKGDTLVTSKQSLPLSEAISNAQTAVKSTSIPGTTLHPISAASVQVDTTTGIVTVNVIEDFSNIAVNGTVV